MALLRFARSCPASTSSTRLVLFAIVTLAAAACSRLPTLLPQPASPHERYAETLRRSGLDQTALGRDWLAAATAALANPIAVTTPFRETGYFPPSEPMALAYRLELQRGRTLSIEVTFESQAPGRLFVDLFAMSEQQQQRLASMDDDATTFTHEIDRDGVYLLRIQPELLRSGRYTLAQRTLASLPFPIPSLTASAVRSVFGDARDAGARLHQGIDIFATRGTPVVAIVGGVARASTNGLGGNVVWLREPLARRTFYYAHLDRWAIDGTRTVRAGDVLGYVGNTGNARTTAPHLHFGIYEGGAINPLPFLQPDDVIAASPSTAAVMRLGELVRLVPPATPLRPQPSTRASAAGSVPARQLRAGVVAHALGVTASWTRLRLPDGSSGYVPSTALAPTDVPLRRQRIDTASPRRELPRETAPMIDMIEAAAVVDVVGRFEDFDLLRSGDGRDGWVRRRN